MKPNPQKNIYEIVEFTSGEKYGFFVLSSGDQATGKQGYFMAACEAFRLTIGREPEFPLIVRLDKLGVDYFHVDKIWTGKVWIGTKVPT